MTTPPRPRGRPRGASRHNRGDATLLDKVADLVTDASPALKPTSAMRRLGIHDPSHHRRLQRKWRAAAPQLEQAARERRRAAAAPRPALARAGFGLTAADLAGFPKIDPVMMRTMQQAVKDAERFRKSIDPVALQTALRAAKAHMEEAKRLQITLDPAAIQAMKAQLDQAKRIHAALHPPHTQIHLDALKLFRG